MTKKQFALRLDPKLYTALEKWATDEFRSVNAHIEFLLREAAHRAGRLKIEEPPKEESNPELKKT
ncbi:hypothetical protein [Desulfitobacterium sp.]|uniref:hypothetical protein n=1 Tax=Desulfitobacterium sp. TaxID=49981 RepID=UPI002C4651A0|nr:hypothetical protein [Desulfitobacterium sp.]HVJ50676.1 hypothetical protein [Desulfitobacterium sp.]